MNTTEQLIAKLRYMGRQYASGQFARGGGPHKHYLEEAADELERLSTPGTPTPPAAPLGKCPTCGSDCNERDELIKAEREIERLRSELSVARDLNDLYKRAALGVPK